MRRTIIAALALAVATAGAASAAPYRLDPWKDDLFAYPRILESAHGGDYLEVEYDRPRDLDARDAERGLKVDPKYVSLDTEAATRDVTIRAGGRTIRTFAVGKVDGGASAIVIFVHGAGAGRDAGMDDWIHGGNFNRIKNLMLRNNGLYLSPSFSNFRARGAADIKALILDQTARSPGAPVFLACGSAGFGICSRLMDDREVQPRLGGLILFDVAIGPRHAAWFAGLPPGERIPVHVSSSREDQLVGWRSQKAFFEALKQAAPDYPVRYVLFSAGTHGLSLRMTDWRETINWMLGEAAK